MQKKDDSNDDLLCSFCGKSQDEVKKLIAGPSVYICDECIQLCTEIIAEEYGQDKEKDTALPKPYEIKELLDKYFKDYKGNRDDLFANNPKFNGDIDRMTSNYAAGIKLYPPLDFDPWPDDQQEKDKVTLLYGYCEKKSIPITAHGGEGGFNVLSKRKVRKLASVSKWKSVLTAYPNLKLNIAHFPVNEKRFLIFPNKKRLNEVLELLANPEFKNLYMDFSCRATNSSYYKALKKLIDQSPLKDVIRRRILFGTDFSVHLMSVPSYNSYYGLFGNDSSLSAEEKELVCSLNPERFLFA